MTLTLNGAGQLLDHHLTAPDETKAEFRAEWPGFSETMGYSPGTDEPQR